MDVLNVGLRSSKYRPSHRMVALSVYACALLSARDVALAASVALILALTALPTTGRSRREFVPFKDVVEAVKSSDEDLLRQRVLESLANIALFVPLGGALAWRGCSLRRTLFYGSALSLTIELAQLALISGRTASASDVLLNTSGTMLGYALLAVVAKTSRQEAR